MTPPHDTAPPGASPAAAGGLDSAEASERLRQYGPNAVPEERPRPVLLLLRKLWGPVPWMLEATLVLQAVLGKWTDAIVIAALLVVNAVLGFLQEGRAQTALALLRSRVAVQVRVRRDGRWQRLLAAELVPGDVVRLRVGDVVPADVRAVDGEVAVDQSALTGESVPVDVGAGGAVHAGTVVQRGEITGEVTATGVHTAYGRTVELVRTARTASHLETLIVTIVKYLVVLDTVLVGAVLAYALATAMPLADVLPFALILLVASVPVALPATFTLAEAVGSLDLARRGVLVTRLSAVEEAAAMDVLCSDKTGTITENALAVAGVQARAPRTDDDVLRLAAAACDEATQDPIDLAILREARRRGLAVDVDRRERFVPFDPATKRSEAVVRQDGAPLRVLKGTPSVIAALCDPVVDVDADIDRLAAAGCRVIAVAAGVDRVGLVGLIGLHDPPRPDSAALLRRLREMGVRILMVTGDTAATARAVAARVGLGVRTCPAEALRGERADDLLAYDVFAGIYPEDKLRLVATLQRAGHTVGMTGDGVNDAPALKQAEVGIAVQSATDVAKAAASVILTRPGLTDVVDAVEAGRRIYQRMLTYTLNKIVKTFELALFLSLGLLLTGTFVTTPHLIVLLLFTNDFVTMTIATDRVTASPRPERWDVGSLVATAGVLAAAWLAFSFAVFLVGRDVLGLELARLQTLVFCMLVFSGQATVYLVRERRRLWASAPSRWLLVASASDVVVVTLLATGGVLMAAVPASLVGGLLALVALYAVVLDALKTRVFALTARRATGQEAAATRSGDAGRAPGDPVRATSPTTPP